MTHNAAAKQTLLCILAVTLAWVGVSEASELRLVGQEVFVATPEDGVRVNARAFYTSNDSAALKSYHDFQTRSDTADIAFQRFSNDNGRSWSDPISIVTNRKTPAGTVRLYPRSGMVDPNQKVLIEFWLTGTLPTDEPLEGMKQWSLRYSLSRDAGRTTYHDGMVYRTGAGFSPQRPFSGVEIGKNSIMIGDQSCVGITLSDGTILQPVQVAPLGPNGEYHNPGGGYTYHDAAVLIGNWTQAGLIDWRLSERVVADPTRSTRGMLEPTIAEFSGQRILMVLRGSNHRKPELPSYKWFCISEDRGRTWSDPKPWGYVDGSTFFSPSSCSQLLKHSNGRTYWIGNVCEANANGNLPRHPLIIGEVDQESLRLIRDSVCVIDERRAGDSERLQVSNFFAREDRETQEILIHCSPFDRVPSLDSKGKAKRNWTANASIYRVAVKSPENAAASPIDAATPETEEDRLHAAMKRDWEAIDTSLFRDSIHHWQMKEGRDRNDDRFHEKQIVHIAENLLQFQNPDGGWPANIDWLVKFDQDEIEALRNRLSRSSTFDNRNTYPQIEYLAHVHTVTGLARYREAAERGLEYILKQQRPSGGWRGKDVDAITFNDDVMVGIMRFLLAIRDRESHFDWVGEATRQAMAESFENALQATLKCQIRVDGQLTAWGQQHSHTTFEPVKARTYELPSICAQESVGVVKLLMDLPNPSDEIVEAITSAMAWFERAKIHGLRIKQIPIDPVRFKGFTATFDRVVEEHDGASAIWARFYEVDTNRPFFCNRDGVKVYRLADVQLERRVGYGWYGTWPASLDARSSRWKSALAD